MKIHVLILTILLIGVGCTASQIKNSENVQSSTQVEKELSTHSDNTEITNENRIAPGHLFHLSQLEDEKLNGRFRIDFEGRLHLPYGVTIMAKGLTLEELREKVANSYQPFFKSSAPIEIDLVDPAFWVEVRGPVIKPGRFLIKKSSTLDEILAMAGGATASVGAVKYVKIIQGKEVRAISLDNYYDSADVSPGFAWKGADIIFFQRDLDSEDGLVEGSVLTKTVKLLGEVRAPGSVPFRKDSDFYYYLAKAGGPTAAADLTKVVLVRGKDFERKTIDFSAESVGQLPSIQEGDTLILYADKPSAFQKFIQTSSGVMTLITSFAFLAVVL